MSSPPRAMVATVRLIDRVVGEWSGQLFCWMAIPLVGGLTYEVIARYVFFAPTEWAYDVTYMLYGSHFMLGGAYTLYRGGHIRTDLFYEKWSPRTQGTIDATAYLLFFFPGMLFILIMGWNEAWLSLLIMERSDASPWRPILWPFKMAIPVSALLLLIQGVSEFLKSLHAARTGERM